MYLHTCAYWMNSVNSVYMHIYTSARILDKWCVLLIYLFIFIWYNKKTRRMRVYVSSWRCVQRDKPVQTDKENWAKHLQYVRTPNSLRNWLENVFQWIYAADGHHHMNHPHGWIFIVRIRWMSQLLFICIPVVYGILQNDIITGNGMQLMRSKRNQKYW